MCFSGFFLLLDIFEIHSFKGKPFKTLMNWALNINSPCLAEQSRDGRWGYTVCASASGSYPETQHHVEKVMRDSKQTKKRVKKEILTPCFMILLAWLATSFTMLRAAIWKRHKLKRKQMNFFLYMSQIIITTEDCQTLCVFVICWFFWKVLQIIWKMLRLLKHHLYQLLYTDISGTIYWVYTLLFVLYTIKKFKLRVNCKNLKRSHCW